MTEEIWRQVVGYEGLYEVSSYGRVRSLDRYDSRNRFLKGRILKLSDDGRGYLRAHLWLNHKMNNFLVHRLVAEAFIPNPYNLPQVNHIDEDKTNNRVENLEMCDAKYNLNYGTRIDRIRDSRLKNGTYTGLSKEEYWKKWYQENRDNKREYLKKWYQENRDKKREYHHQYYLKKKAGL